MVTRRHFIGVGSLAFPVVLGAAQIYLPRRRPPQAAAAAAGDSDSREYWREGEALPKASFSATGFEYWRNGETF